MLTFKAHNGMGLESIIIIILIIIIIIIIIEIHWSVLDRKPIWMFKVQTHC